MWVEKGFYIITIININYYLLTCIIITIIITLSGHLGRGKKWSDLKLAPKSHFTAHTVETALLLCGRVWVNKYSLKKLTLIKRTK